MAAAAVEVGERRWRESRGRCYADSAIGDVCEHRPGRASRSRQSQGIFTVPTRAYQADGTPVLAFKRTMLLPRRGHAIEHQIAAAEAARPA